MQCLDSLNNGYLYTLGCNGGDNQAWYWKRGSGNSGDKIINSKTGRCLDSNARGSAYTLPCNGGSFQLWTATPTDPKGTRTWKIQNKATGRCLASTLSDKPFTIPCLKSSPIQGWIEL